MDTIFNDYMLYYEARMKRRQQTDIYSHSYLSEKAIYELVASCNSMEDIQARAAEFRALSVQNAIALVKDQEMYRKQVYEDCKEFIRAEAPAAILEMIDSMQVDMEIVEMVNRVHQKNSIDITLDQLTAMFYSDFTAMENIEVYKQARIPEEWRAACDGYAQDSMDSGKKLWRETQLPEARNWQPGWTLNYDLLHETRHRRLIPVNDVELEKKIALHKMYKPA
jgi:hypothetical protein